MKERETKIVTLEFIKHDTCIAHVELIKNCKTYKALDFIGFRSTYVKFVYAHNDLSMPQLNNIDNVILFFVK